jgi:hypothetical protein
MEEPWTVAVGWRRHGLLCSPAFRNQGRTGLVGPRMNGSTAEGERAKAGSYQRAVVSVFETPKKSYTPWTAYLDTRGKDVKQRRRTEGTRHRASSVRRRPV